MHAGFGHRVEWEDPFVAVFGNDWRSQRNSCEEAVWIARCSTFEEHLCREWGLFNGKADAPEPVCDPAPTCRKRKRTATHLLEQLLETMVKARLPSIATAPIAG